MPRQGALVNLCQVHLTASGRSPHLYPAKWDLATYPNVQVASENLPDSDIKRALQEIPEDFRIAVYLADVEGFSYKEIAEIVGTPAGTVMSRLHRGRKLLREKLAVYAAELGYGKEVEK